mmetsp:Transcript_56825/g.158252  ORF Transcript_56825/g.158252 Transcript_56825/m.158252 type:complete len:320 (+) Transcript_56825:616-1575(+)
MEGYGRGLDFVLHPLNCLPKLKAHIASLHAGTNVSKESLHVRGHVRSARRRYEGVVLAIGLHPRATTPETSREGGHHTRPCARRSRDEILRELGHMQSDLRPYRYVAVGAASVRRTYDGWPDHDHLAYVPLLPLNAQLAQTPKNDRGPQRMTDEAHDFRGDAVGLLDPTSETLQVALVEGGISPTPPIVVESEDIEIPSEQFSQRLPQHDGDSLARIQRVDTSQTLDNSHFNVWNVCRRRDSTAILQAAVHCPQCHGPEHPRGLGEYFFDAGPAKVPLRVVLARVRPAQRPGVVRTSLQSARRQAMHDHDGFFLLHQLP